MSPRTRPPTAELPVALSLLPALLDLPPGTGVAKAEIDGEVLRLTLTGTGMPKGEITADYTVDAHGRRTFNTFKSPGGDSSGITPDGAAPNPEEE